MWFLVACQGKGSLDVVDEAPADTADADADADADSDADADTDTDAEPTPALPRLLDADHVLVVPHGEGLVLLGDDGARRFDATWTELLGGDCSRCGGEGASADGDGLLLSLTTRGPTGGGAIARLGPTGLDWRLDGFGFPHDAVRDPADASILVPEVIGDRVTWMAGDGTSAAAIRRLDNAVPQWEGELPNGADRYDVDGRSLLLLSHRGAGNFLTGSGIVTLWDITDPAAPPTLVWRHPAEGYLRTPHGPVLREVDGQKWLLYAHTDGRNDTGTVGVALLSAWTAQPQYVADLVPTGVEAPFEFLRGVELTDDGQLWLTDSGPGGGTSVFRQGRVLSAAFPAGLTPAVESGGFGDRHEVEIAPSLFADELVNPFEGWLWVPTF